MCRASTRARRNLLRGVTVVTHPLVQHNLTQLREPTYGALGIQARAARSGRSEATRSFSLRPVSVRTPLADTKGFHLQQEVVIIPILRAGLGMLDAILLLPGLGDAGDRLFGV